MLKKLIMAKNFPYFKFIATEWLTGNIVFESLETQGMFINVCSLYWVKDGILPLEDLNKRYKNHESILVLISNGYILVENGFVSIEFLNEQLRDANHISLINSEKGKKSAAVKALKIKENLTAVEQNSTGVQPNSTNKIKEKKIKENKRKEEYKEDVLFEKEPKFDFKKNLISYGFSEKLVEEWLQVRKTKKATNTETAFKKFTSEIESLQGLLSLDDILSYIIEKSWSGFKKSWYLEDLKRNNNGKQSAHDTKQQSIANFKDKLEGLLEGNTEIK